MTEPLPTSQTLPVSFTPQNEENEDESVLDQDKTPTASPPTDKPADKSEPSVSTKFEPTLRQQNAQKLLFQFSKTFVSVMETTVFSKSSYSDDEDDEAFDDFDHFEHRFSSYSTLEQHQPISDEEFAFEKFFPSDQKTSQFRPLFCSVAFELFTAFEYQLIVLVREKRKISEIAEDIVHRILDNFKESVRGSNPDFVKPEITLRSLIELALQHTEPEGITYNSEWSAVEILENPGILIPCDKKERDAKGFIFPGLFYQSDWQKNFMGVKKKIGSKYGFRLKFPFETEISILRNFEKVPFSSVYPPYLQYDYILGHELLEDTRKQLERELGIEEKMKRFGIFGEERHMKDKVKEFQIKLQIQKLEEDRNSDKVMAQVAGQNRQRVGVEKLRDKLVRLEERGVIKPEEIEKVKTGLLRSHYNVKFEVKEPANCGEFMPFPLTK